MSELKAIRSGEIYDIIEYEDCYRTDDLYYPKSEADKMIAELKQKINEAQTELELWRDGSIISEAHQKELDEKRHSDYKRCLAMASTCRLRARWFGDNAFYKRERWALQWHRRWLKIAEQFKEAS